MTILEFVDDFTNKKIYLNRNFIRITFYEFRLKFGLTKDEADKCIELSKIRFINLGYRVYLTGEEYFYKGEQKKVETNELLIAIKERDVK